MSTITIKVRYDSGGMKNGFINGASTALRNSISKIANIAKTEAITYYLELRKPINPPQSRIVDSFTYEEKTPKGGLFTGIVFAGGPGAPYAIYVDEGHGRFGGYKFMEAGFKAAEEATDSTVDEELNKVKW